MKFFVLVLSVSLSTVYSVPNNNTNPAEDNGKGHPWYESQDFSYSVTVDVRRNGTSIRYCGGAQVGLEWVITAAECLYETGGDAIVMTYKGERLKYKQKLFLMGRANFTIHPLYEPRTKVHNLALIKCQYCGTEHKDVIPTIPSTFHHQDFSQKSAVLTGVLSITHAKTIYGYYVQSIKTRVVSLFWCKVAYIFSVGDDNICASRLAGRLPRAEVGAPLVIEGQLPGLVQLVGIGTSISHWPHWIPFPIVFTRVDTYSDWIRNVTKIK